MDLTSSVTILTATERLWLSSRMRSLPSTAPDLGSLDRASELGALPRMKKMWAGLLLELLPEIVGLIVVLGTSFFFLRLDMLCAGEVVLLGARGVPTPSVRIISTLLPPILFCLPLLSW